MNKPSFQPIEVRWIRYYESPPAVDPITQAHLNDYAREILALPNMAIHLSEIMPEALTIANWTEEQLAKLRRVTHPIRYGEKK